MLTPTNVTAAEYNTAVKADARSHIKMTFLGQNIVLTDEDIESDGFELKQYLNGTTDLNFGSAVMSEITVKIFNSVKVTDLVWNSEFKLEIGLDIDDDTTEWITLGYFTGQRPDKVRLVDIIDFTAYDRMQMFEVLADDFLDGLEYPKTVSQIYSALCDYVGIEKEAGNELANIMSRSFSSSPISDVGLTCRDVLSMIAEACGCYAKITAGGKCKMIWYTDQSSYSIDAQDQYNMSRFDLLSGKTWQDLESYTWEQMEQFRWEDLGGYQAALAVKGLIVKYTDDDVGVSIPENASTNLYLIVDNPFLVYLQDSDVANYFQPIFDRLDSFGGYLPMDVECVGNCLVEAGDIISVNIGDNSVKMPIFCKTLHWNGSCTDVYEATGNMERDIGTSIQRQKLTRNSKFHKYRVDINELYSEINDPETGLRTIVNQQEGQIAFMAEYKATVYYSATTPTGTEENPLAEGDLWIDTVNNNQLKRYNGSDWGDASFNDPDKYTVRSGVDILPEGIEVSGGKYVKIQSGGVFDVDSTNFKVSSGDKLFRSGDWQIDEGGLVGIDHAYNSDVGFKIGTRLNIPTPDWMSDLMVYGLRGYKSTLSNYQALQVYLQTVAKYNDTQYTATFGFGFEGTPSYQWKKNSGDTSITDVHAIATFGYVKMIGTLSNMVTYLFCQKAYVSDIEPYETTYKNNDYETTAVAIGHCGTSYHKWAYIYGYYIYYNVLTQLSSRDVKHDIKALPSVGEKLDMLQPVTFVYNDDKNEKQRTGLIYEDTIDVMPEICEENEGNKSINYTELIPMLLKEIQDLRKRVAELEARQ